MIGIAHYYNIVLIVFKQGLYKTVSGDCKIHDYDYEYKHDESSDNKYVSQT